MSFYKLFDFLIIIFVELSTCDQFSVLIEYSKSTLQSHKVSIVFGVTAAFTYPGD